MTDNKPRTLRSPALRFTLAVLLLVSSLVAARTVWAAAMETVRLAATQDTYTDLNLATTNLNASLLTAANSPGPLGSADVTTKQIFLAFDLSGVDFEIENATLRLSTLTCGG